MFVVQPIGAVPDGVTLVLMGRRSQFVESADGICLRSTGQVTLLCRMAAFAKVGQEDKILIRLPYSKTLYLWSTNGQSFEN